MKEFARNSLPAAILAGLCYGAAMAADISTLGNENGPFAVLNKFGEAG